MRNAIESTDRAYRRRDIPIVDQSGAPLASTATELFSGHFAHLSTRLLFIVFFHVFARHPYSLTKTSQCP